MSYEASDIILHYKKYDDVVIGFLNSLYGREIILRCGVARNDILEFLKERIEKEQKDEKGGRLDCVGGVIRRGGKRPPAPNIKAGSRCENLVFRKKKQREKRRSLSTKGE